MKTEYTVFSVFLPKRGSYVGFLGHAMRSRQTIIRHCVVLKKITPNEVKAAGIRVSSAVFDDVELAQLQYDEYWEAGHELNTRHMVVGNSKYRTTEPEPPPERAQQAPPITLDAAIASAIFELAMSGETIAGPSGARHYKVTLTPIAKE